MKTNLTETDKKLIKIVKIVCDTEDNIDVILIGGRAINIWVDQERYSKDSDMTIVGIENKLTQSKFKTFCKKIVKKISEEFGLEIIRAEDNKDYLEKISKRISTYIDRKNVFKISININNDEHIIEFSMDETIDNIPTQYNNELELKIVPIEYMLAVKIILSAKRIDEDTIFDRANFRHIYDVYRILVSNNKIDIKNLINYLESINAYEMSREAFNDYEYNLSIGKALELIINWFDLEIKEAYVDQLGVNRYFSKNINKLIYQLEQEYKIRNTLSVDISSKIVSNIKLLMQNKNFKS